MPEPTPEPVPDGAIPEVSIIIPAHGVAAYIGETLASVMAQTVTTWEAIVVNDGSPDTPTLEAALEPYRERIRYEVQPHRGAAAARNTAVHLARGQWLAFLDGDDVWEPDFLACQLTFIQENGLDMAWSDGWLVDPRVITRRRLMTNVPSAGQVTVMALLTARVQVTTSAVVVHRRSVEEVGGFDESLIRGQDFDLWVRLVHQGVRAACHPEPLIHHRVRRGGLSGDDVTQAQRAVTVLQRLREKLALAEPSARILDAQIADAEAHLALATGKQHLARGEYAATRDQLLAASHRLPTAKLRLARLLLRFTPGLLRRLHLARNPDGGL